MNVLIAMQAYSANHITGISMMSFMMDVIQMVNVVRQDVNWFFCVPETAESIKWSPEDFAHLDRVELLPLLSTAQVGRGSDGFDIDFPFYSPKLFKFFDDKKIHKMDVLMSGFFTAQVVPCMQSEYSPLDHYMIPRVEPPVVVNLFLETWVDKALDQLDTPIGKICGLSSILASGLSIVLTKADLSAIKEVAKEYLAPSQIRRMDIRQAIPAVNIDKVPVYDRPDDRCVFFHGGTFEAKRHLKFLLPEIGKIRAIVPNVETLITTQWDHVPKWAADLGFLNTVLSCNRKMFHQKLADGDFLLCYIDYEGTGLAYTEAILSGMTPIIMAKPWNEGRFDRDYPLMCHTESEFVQKMAFCAKHPAQAKEYGAKFVGDYRQKMSSKVQGEFWSKVIDDAFQIRLDRTLKRMKQKRHFFMPILEKVIPSMPAQFSGQELINSVVKGSTGLDDAKAKSMWWALRVLTQTFAEIKQIAGCDHDTAIFIKE